jgi:hypothetical protein
MPILVVNEDFVSERHIAWFTKEESSGADLGLYEIVERKYWHPEAPGEAFVVILESLLRKSAKRLS